MPLIGKLKEFFSEAQSFDAFFCLTAIVFAYLGNEAILYKKKLDFSSVCFLFLVDAFYKAFLAEAMCYITWKVLLYIEDVNLQRRGIALGCLTVIHVIWIYLTNLCFTCMLTELETVLTLLECLVLLTIIIFFVHWIISNLKPIYTTLDDAKNTSAKIKLNPIIEDIQPIAQEPLSSVANTNQSINSNELLHESLQLLTQEQFSSNDNLNPSSSSNDMQMNNCISEPSTSQADYSNVSMATGAPLCHHRITRSPLTTLRSQDSGESSCQANPNAVNEINQSAPPNEGSTQSNPEYQVLQSKTRSGCIYKTVKISRNSSNITRM